MRSEPVTVWDKFTRSEPNCSGQNGSVKCGRGKEQAHHQQPKNPAQGTQELGYVCEFVGNIAHDPKMKNIQKSTMCDDTIVCEGNWTAEQPDVDRVVEGSFDEELVGDTKQGCIPVR